MIGKSNTRHFERCSFVSATLKLRRHVDTLFTKCLRSWRYYWWTKLMHLCAHIDKLHIQQGCNSCRHSYYAMSLSLCMPLLCLFHQVVCLQLIVLCFVLSQFRSVEVVLIPCRAIWERGLECVDDVSERRPRNGASVPARQHHIVIPVNQTKRSLGVYQIKLNSCSARKHNCAYERMLVGAAQNYYRIVV